MLINLILVTHRRVRERAGRTQISFSFRNASIGMAQTMLHILQYYNYQSQQFHRERKHEKRCSSSFSSFSYSVFNMPQFIEMLDRQILNANFGVAQFDGF